MTPRTIQRRFRKLSLPSLLNNKCKFKEILADFRVMTTADVEVIVERRVTKPISALHPLILKAVEFVFKDALQVRYSTTNSGFKAAILGEVEKH